MGLLDADGDPDNAYRGAEWLLQSCPLGSGPPPGLKVPWLVPEPGIVMKGHPCAVTAWLLNDGPDAIPGVAVRLLVPQGVRIDNPISLAFDLAHGEAHRLRWMVRTARPGPLALRLQVTAPGRSLQKTRWVTVVDRRDPRREFETQGGDWLPYPARPTLQQANPATLTRITPLPSSRLKHNLFGITAHLPRSVNDEDPFIPERALDGDPATCWASRWWRIAVPLDPEWLQVDLGHVATAGEVRFLPAKGDVGLPASLTVEVSADGKSWTTVAADVDYHLCAPGWQSFTFAPRTHRYARLTATRLNQGGTSFFCAPFEPFQFRVAEVALADASGAVLHPVRASASTTHNAWYNTPETVTRTWPLLLNSGVKLNRINQWGDRLDWATVEKTRGVYVIPPEADRALTQSHAAGVETLLTLDYGNNLYQRVKNAPTSASPGSAAIPSSSARRPRPRPSPPSPVTAPSWPPTSAVA